MGNVLCAPAPGQRCDIHLDRVDGASIQKMLEKIADEADANARLARQRYERRRRRYEEGDHNTRPRATEPRHQRLSTVPEYNTPASRGMTPPGPPDNHAGDAPGPSNPYVDDQDFQTHLTQEGLYGNDAGKGTLDGRGPPPQGYGLPESQARQNDANRGWTPPPRRRKRPQGNREESVSSEQRSRYGQ
ncbi:MAG: hypothetical protein Q9173_000093 [Seirophora scorigena]